MRYVDSSFTVGLTSEKYRQNYDQINWKGGTTENKLVVLNPHIVPIEKHHADGDK